jgi:hypothetical protein
MIITEEELRQAWQNGQGQIPAFPPGTRFTPAALDFLKAREPGVIQACSTTGAHPSQAVAERKELKAPPGQRLIFTTLDVPDLLAGGGSIFVVHPSVTLTHSALDKLRSAGVRVIPYVEPSFIPPVSPPDSAPHSSAGVDEELFRKVKEAVLARLGKPVDRAILDAVLRKVLAAL